MISNYLQYLTPAAIQALTFRPTRIALACTVPSSLTPYPELEDELNALTCVDLNLTDAELSPASLGLACRTFWRENALQPINLKIAPEPSPADKLLIRRLQLHDILHVLLGFDASPAGQLGVFSFIAAQHYCPQFERSARLFAQLYVTMAPWARDELADAEYRGWRLALNTPRLLTTPIELEWNTSLVELRDKLNIRKACTLRGITEAPAPTIRMPRFTTIEQNSAHEAPPV